MGLKFTNPRPRAAEPHAPPTELARRTYVCALSVAPRPFLKRPAVRSGAVSSASWVGVPSLARFEVVEFQHLMDYRLSGIIFADIFPSLWLIHFLKHGAPEWLRRLSVRLSISAQVSISGS